MAYAGAFKAYDLEAQAWDKLITCSHCGNNMGKPAIYEHTFHQFDKKVSVHKLWGMKRFETREALLEEIQKIYTETEEGEKDFILAYGLMNECLQCGSVTSYMQMKHGQSPKLEVQETSVRTAYNPETKEASYIFTEDKNTLPAGSHYIYTKRKNQNEEELKEPLTKLRHSFMKQVMDKAGIKFDSEGVKEVADGIIARIKDGE